MPNGGQEEKQHRVNPPLLTHARRMRVERPAAEDKLWAQLRNQQTRFRFRYQHPIGNYIVDFCCPSARLIVEVDGDSHAAQQE